MIRLAQANDAKTILELIEFHADSEQMLFRTLDDIRNNIQNFLVYEDAGVAIGTCALSACGSGLVEVRSLAVHPGHYRKGVGTALVEHCIERATQIEFEKIFVLTYALPLFAKLGFEIIDKAALPQKIWKDCQVCRKQDHCDETAMIRSLAGQASLSRGGKGLTVGNAPQLLSASGV
ncbi:MAG: N-acetyltransferase [Nitrospina sp.]|nr:MAG: N-acetyltransferase [Nitrospina sp.]